MPFRALWDDSTLESTYLRARRVMERPEVVQKHSVPEPKPQVWCILMQRAAAWHHCSVPVHGLQPPQQRVCGHSLEPGVGQHMWDSCTAAPTQLRTPSPAEPHRRCVQLSAAPGSLLHWGHRAAPPFPPAAANRSFNCAGSQTLLQPFYSFTACKGRREYELMLWPSLPGYL